jgi:hypothetical protein
MQREVGIHNAKIRNYNYNWIWNECGACEKSCFSDHMQYPYGMAPLCNACYKDLFLGY